MPQVVIDNAGSRRRARRIGLVVLAAMLVVAGAVTFIVLKTAPKVTYADTVGVEQQANALVQSGQVPAALVVYDKAIKRAADQQTKGVLYSKKANVEYGAKQLDGALRDALSADQILAGSGTSAYVAMVYEQRGEPAQAAKYYRQAADRVQANRPTGPSKQFYLDKAQALEGTKS